jgi:hypothetical protein
MQRQLLHYEVDRYSRIRLREIEAFQAEADRRLAYDMTIEDALDLQLKLQSNKRWLETQLELQKRLRDEALQSLRENTNSLRNR